MCVVLVGALQIRRETVVVVVVVVVVDEDGGGGGTMFVDGANGDDNFKTGM